MFLCVCVFEQSRRFWLHLMVKYSVMTIHPGKLYDMIFQMEWSYQERFRWCNKKVHWRSGWSVGSFYWEDSFGWTLFKLRLACFKGRCHVMSSFPTLNHNAYSYFVDNKSPWYHFIYLIFLNSLPLSKRMKSNIKLPVSLLPKAHFLNFIWNDHSFNIVCIQASVNSKPNF